MKLKSLSVDRLIGLRSQVDAALGSKVAQQRKNLEAKLSSLTRFGSGPGRTRGAKPGKIAPKYRNPENPSETWAGRGLKPLWVTAAIKAGKKLEDFSIGGTAKASSAKPRKVARKPQK